MIQIDYVDIIMILIILGFAFLLFSTYKDDKFDGYLKDMDKRLRDEQAALKPLHDARAILTWSKENGFNRAPTLAEAMRFTPDASGDEVRAELIANDEKLPIS